MYVCTYVARAVESNCHQTRFSSCLRPCARSSAKKGLVLIHGLTSWAVGVQSEQTSTMRERRKNRCRICHVADFHDHPLVCHVADFHVIRRYVFLSSLPFLSSWISPPSGPSIWRRQWQANRIKFRVSHHLSEFYLATTITDGNRRNRELLLILESETGKQW